MGGASANLAVSKVYPVRTGSVMFYVEKEYIRTVCITHLTGLAITAMTGLKTGEIMRAPGGFIQYGIRHELFHLCAVPSSSQKVLFDR